MKKLSAILSGAYITMISSAALAAEEILHGEHMEKMEEGIEAAEHASKGGLPQFDPTWFASQIFWLAISFAVLYFIFSKKTLPEISGVIENRKNHIQSDLEMAESLTAKADAVHDTYQQKLTQSQAKAAQAVHDVENDMKVLSAQAFDNFRARSEKEIKSAEGRIQTSKANMMDEMNTIAAQAAAEAVKKIIGTSTDAKKVKQIVESMNEKAKAA